MVPKTKPVYKKSLSKIAAALFLQAPKQLIFNNIYNTIWYTIMPHEAMHKCGLCHHVVSVFVTFVDHQNE